MKNYFEIIASSTKFVRLQRNIDQESAANEAGISLRTIQNIEAAKAVNSSSLFAYLSYLGLLDNMLSVLPDPAKLTPMELLKTAPKRRSRARGTIKTQTTTAGTKTTLSNNFSNMPTQKKKGFQWGDEK